MRRHPVPAVRSWPLLVAVLIGPSAFLPACSPRSGDGEDTPDSGADSGPDSDYCATYGCWLVPPTGQSTCYDDTAVLTDCPGGVEPPACGAAALPFCGQDAQYRDTERALACRSAAGALVPCPGLPTASAGEIVEDTLTGLAWQRTFATAAPWPSAGDYCSSLNSNGGYAGRSDWRLPSVYELATLIDLGRSQPAIDTTAFPGTPAELFWWSATADALHPGLAWGVGFGAGDVNAGQVQSSFYVRCTAGPALFAAEGPNRFSATSASPEAAFVDRATGLSWRKEIATAERWADALAHCESLVADGEEDWRLPNAAELRSLVRVDLAEAKSSFPGMPPDCFWSSTTSAGSPNAAWVVSFASGHVFVVSKTNAFSVRCARGGP